MKKNTKFLLLPIMAIFLFSIINTVNAQTTYTLTMDAIGNGDITPTLGNHVYNSGESVQVFANASSGWVFTIWDLYNADTNAWIANTTTNPVTLTMTMNYKSVATFTEIPATPTPTPTETPIEPVNNNMVIGLAIVFFFAIFNTLFILMKPCLEVMILSLVVMAFTIIIGVLIVLPINQMLGIFMCVYSVFAFFITVLRVQV